jgi:peroxiredoxin
MHALPADSAPAKTLNNVGLPLGSPAPEFVLPDIDGRQHDLHSIRARGAPVLLIFSSPFCESCQALMPKLPGLAAQHAEALRLVVVSRGTVQQNVAKMKGPFTLPVLLQQDFEVAEAYDCGSTPAAVLVGADGVIRSLLAVGGPAIVQLIAASIHPHVTS